MRSEGRVSAAWSVVAAVSVVLLAMALGASLLTLLPGTHSMAQSLAAVAFVGALATAGTVLFFRSLTSPRCGWRRELRSTWTYDTDRSWLDDVPAPLVVSVVVAVLLLGALAIASISHLGGGAPVQRDGRYFQSNHGVDTEISESAYSDAVAAEVRLFSAGSGIALGITAVVAATQRARCRPHRMQAATT